jgi:hypothetical protein
MPHTKTLRSYGWPRSGAETSGKKKSGKEKRERGGERKGEEKRASGLSERRVDGWEQPRKRLRYAGSRAGGVRQQDRSSVLSGADAATFISSNGSSCFRIRQNDQAVHHSADAVTLVIPHLQISP